MANYKRVISYMYQYRNQLQGSNVGFARIETRDTQCKITINVRVPNMKEQDIKSYMYCWYDNEMHGIFLGNVHISNGVGELVVKTDVDNIMNSKYRLTEMGGILLFVTTSQYLGTEWDGKPVICDGLFIDNKKPEDFADRVRNQKKKAPVIAASTETNEDSSLHDQELVDISSESSLHTETQKEIASGLDALIEDEVAKESKETKVGTATLVKVEEVRKSSVLDQVDMEPVPIEERQISGQQVQEQETSTMAEVPLPEIEEQQIRETEEQALQQEENERPNTFPISEEKMNHLDQQAQELFGTMLLNSLFPEDAETKTETDTKKCVEPVENEPPVLSAQAETKETIKISPKSAIECFTAFRSCESEQEYKEVQDEIKTMHAEIAHLELVSKEWRMKQARIEEETAAREEYENDQERIEQELRKSYHIDGVKDSVEAAALGGNVVDRIFHKYPAIQPFKDGEVEECIRIEPQDLGIFPMENWILANNSFLLHGYYTYRHLIFAKEQENGVEKFVLGVPGVNNSRERFMANMFGFKEFKTLAQQEDNNGDFGYWCQEIYMHI